MIKKVKQCVDDVKQVCHDVIETRCRKGENIECKEELKKECKTVYNNVCKNIKKKVCKTIYKELISCYDLVFHPSKWSTQLALCLAKNKKGPNRILAPKRHYVSQQISGKYNLVAIYFLRKIFST